MQDAGVLHNVIMCDQKHHALYLFCHEHAKGLALPASLQLRVALFHKCHRDAWFHAGLGFL